MDSNDFYSSSFSREPKHLCTQQCLILTPAWLQLLLDVQMSSPSPELPNKAQMR